MKLNASITILVNQDRTTIVIKDNDSFSDFLEIELTPEQLSSALSRLGNTPVKSCEIRAMDILGKRLEVDELEFEVPAGYNAYGDRKQNEELLHNKALSLCKNGWIPDSYYRSQNSFFTKGDKKYARTTIRRWI